MSEEYEDLIEQYSNAVDELHKDLINIIEELEKQLDQANERLGKLLEDILEKYGVDIQNLDYILEDYSKNQGRYFAICEEMDDLKKDRNTWKRACELTCKHIAEVEWFSCPETDDISESENEIKTLTKQSLNFFYQQAKKEKEGESK